MFIIILNFILFSFLHPMEVDALTTGADVSWVTQQEKAGVTFRDSSGQTTDLFKLLKSDGLQAVRLRVFVNPPDGWCNGADTLAKAKRAKAQGLKIMIDFHYSDKWADPGQQDPPTAWQSHTLAQLITDVYSHTQGILKYLKDNGITVDWVQVGNEINTGMLWPTGKTSGSKFGNLAQLLNSGYNAVKAVYPNAKTIIHLSNCYDNKMFRWFFDGIKKAGVKWDIIGASHYPTASNWQTLNVQCGTNMADMIKRYSKAFMIAEVGMSNSEASAAKSMIADLVGRVNGLGASKGLGVFYWEPQAYPGWQGYQMGAITSGGQFTEALSAL